VTKEKTTMAGRRFFIPLLLIPAAIFAQAGRQGDRPSDQRPFERIEQLRKVRLIEILDMKEEQTVRFFARLNEHDNARRDLMKEKGEALDRVERLIRNKAEEKEYQKAFDDVVVADDRLIAEQRKFFAGLSEILSVQQRGKLLIFERRFERELREAMREAQRHRREQREVP
jgi:molybdopterin converting factor small subunit